MIIMQVITNQDKILTIIVTKSVGHHNGEIPESQNAGNAYLIRNLEYIRTSENGNVMKTTVHRCHVTKEMDEGMRGSDTK